ncbi:Variant-specific surface protein [Giardia duodenalis]|uniref:Variant-specific surface protein n=1 Tax=Giardia intestinalis TaxID=5741 RepID=V6THB5_GIAIN|nr:Variant-specific surface protein [Giardia intestinalis]
MLGLLFLGAVVSSTADVFGQECTTAAQKDTCVTKKCITVSGAELCRECVGGKVPIDGICKDTTDPSVSSYGCEHTGSTGLCASCKDTAFLFYGSCYAIDKVPGNLVCSKAESGKCTKCKQGLRSLFTNPDGNAAERCILCYDNVGFGSYKGVDGCRYCLPPLTGETSAECNWCQNEKYGPIDGVCKEPGRHLCADGACSNCYMTHIQHNGGCYEKTKAVAQKICITENQFQVINITACKKCAIKGEVPMDGRCIKALLEPKCNPYPNTDGSCTNCTRSGVNYNTFLFNGGCYNMSDYIGSQICTKVNDRAECDAWNTGDYGVFKLPDYHMAYPCSNTSAGGIQGCSRCRYDTTKKKVICYDCEYDTLAFDGMSCITETSCNGNHRQPKCPGSSKRGCRCECMDKYYRSGEQCSACASSCLRCNNKEANSCTLCPSGQALAYNDNETAGTCKAGCTPDSICEACGLEVDQTKYCSKCKDSAQYPLNGACTPANGARTSACLRQSDGACQQCSSGYFLMGGGCYQVSKYPGRFVCKRADSGKCVDTTDEYSINSKGELVDCNSNCETCVKGQKTQCLSCHSNKYLKKEEATSYGTCVSRNDCKDGYYANHGTMECLPCNINDCVSCHLIDKSILCSLCRGASLVGLDKHSCTTIAPENAVEFWGRYVCNEDSVLSGNACVRKDSQNTGRLSNKASIGIGVGVSMVVLVLIGVLIWWLVFQRRRGSGFGGSRNMLTSRD